MPEYKMCLKKSPAIKLDRSFYLKQVVSFPPFFICLTFFLFHFGLAAAWKTFFHDGHFGIRNAIFHGLIQNNFT